MPPKVKHCHQIAIPPSAKGAARCSSGSEDEMLGASAPPPASSSPPQLIDIPTSIVIKKSVASTPTPIAPLPQKKLMLPSPCIKGQVGHVFFSLDVPRSYTEILPGHTVIISKFRKTYLFEVVNSKYILIDPLDNKWTASEVFNKWREVVEHGDLHDLDLKQYHLGLVRYGREYKLTSSLHKTSYKDEIFPIHTKDFPLADEDAREQKDPDFIPDKELD